MWWIVNVYFCRILQHKNRITKNLVISFCMALPHIDMHSALLSFPSRQSVPAIAIRQTVQFRQSLHPQSKRPLPDYCRALVQFDPRNTACRRNVSQNKR